MVDGALVYEAEVMLDGREMEILVSQGGEFLGCETEDDDDDDQR